MHAPRIGRALPTSPPAFDPSLRYAVSRFQEKTADCAIFMMRTAEAIARGADTKSFATDEMRLHCRRQVVLQLLRGTMAL